MAKGSMLMGTQYGKLGESVLYRASGTQRQRAYVPVIRNPRSSSQMVQRVRLANLVSVFRSIQRLAVDSFTNRPVRQSGYNAFVAANLGSSNVFLTKGQAEAGAAVVFPYVISSGTLQPLQIYGEGVNSRTNIYVGDLTITDATTVGAVSTAILANNQAIQVGDEITYLSLLQSTNVNTGVPVVSFSHYSFVVNTSDTTLFRNKMPPVAASVRAGFIGHGDSIGSGAFAWLYSRKKADGTMNASRQALVLTSEDVNAAYTSEAAKLAAIASYNVQPDSIISPDGTAQTSASSGDVVSTTPSISAVRVAGQALSSTTQYLDISSSSNIVISGSNLTSEGVSLIINGGAAITPTLTGSGNSLSGTLTGVTDNQLRSLVVRIDGVSLFSVTLTDPDDDIRI